MADYGVYATMEEVKEYLTSTEEANFHPKDDQKIQRFCIQASRTFDSFCNRRFFPRLQTRYYDHPYTYSNEAYRFYLQGNSSAIGNYPNIPTQYINLSMLALDDDLLEMITLTTQNGNTIISSDDYFLMTGDDYNYPPYDRVVLRSDSSRTVFLFSGTPQQANSAYGIWGYNERYSQAWQQIDTVEDNPLSSSATLVTVNDVDGMDEQGLTPRFQLQQLIRFGNTTTSEMAYITSKDVDNNTITVIRGINGTTAVQQAQNTAIYVYRPQPEITLALMALATYSYRRPGNIGRPEIDQPIATSTGVVIMPPQLPNEVQSMVNKYKRSPIGNQSLL